jgi:hypothetical protein
VSVWGAWVGRRGFLAPARIYLDRCGVSIIPRISSNMISQSEILCLALSSDSLFKSNSMYSRIDKREVIGKGVKLSLEE